ncbi:hypothetical protein ABZZ74_50660 [Streptomyces sp. NPDC006476]|uniref:hypothetical protein n=1 Tax=Streptomyces sp. NPDC006476 TaxID=3157175 RepID=UPI0033ADA5B8
MRTTHRFIRYSLPVALGAAATVAALATSPASADSGWWYSTNGGAKGRFIAAGDKTTACDIKADGYLALVQILTINNSLLNRVADTKVDGKCTTKGASYFDLQDGATYKIEACTVKTGGRPVNCSSAHQFTA